MSRKESYQVQNPVECKAPFLTDSINIYNIKLLLVVQVFFSLGYLYIHAYIVYMLKRIKKATSYYPIIMHACLACTITGMLRLSMSHAYYVEAKELRCLPMISALKKVQMLY